MRIRLISLSLLALQFVVGSVVWAEGDAETAKVTENRPGVAVSVEAESLTKQIESRAKDPNVAKHTEAVKFCQSAVKTTDSNCAASQNPNAQAATQQQQQYAAASGSTGGGGGQGASCGDFGGLAKSLGDLASAFKNQCEGARKACETPCKEKAAAAAKTCDTIAALPNPPEEKKLMLADCKANAETVKKYATKVTSTCGGGYAPNAQQAQALMGLASGIMSAMQKCEEDVGTEDTATETKTDKACMLSADPAACTRSDVNGLSDMAKKAKADAPDGSLAGAQPSLDGEATAAKAAGKAGSLPFAPGGGSGVSASAKAADPKADAPGGKPINTDIYAGDQGGGGGGRGVAGGGYPDTPEGVGKAIIAAELRRDSIAKQFTGGNGRSNWQKVNETYKGTSPTLLTDSAQRNR